LARSHGLPGGIGDRGEQRSRARPRRQPLGLPEWGEVTQHGRASSPIALPLNRLIEPHPRPTAFIPRVEQIRLVRIEETRGAGAIHKTGGVDILGDGFAMQPDVPRQTAKQISGHQTDSIFNRYDIVDEEDIRAGLLRTQSYLEKTGHKIVTVEEQE